MTAPTHVWLEFPETGGKALFAIEAADDWRARGWADCDPLPDPDLTHDPGAADSLAGSLAAPAEPEPEPAEPAEPTPTSSRKGSSAPKEA